MIKQHQDQPRRQDPKDRQNFRPSPRKVHSSRPRGLRVHKDGKPLFLARTLPLHSGNKMPYKEGKVWDGQEAATISDQEEDVGTRGLRSPELWKQTAKQCLVVDRRMEPLRVRRLTDDCPRGRTQWQHAAWGGFREVLITL